MAGRACREAIETGNTGDFLRRADDTTDAINVIDVAGGEMQNPAEGRVIEELSGK